MNDAMAPLVIENEIGDVKKVRDFNKMKHRRFNIIQDEKKDNFNLQAISMLQQQDQIIAQVAKVSFENFIVTIFTDTGKRRSPRQFYFEPLVLLDSNSIITESNAFLKQEFVRFTVKMWNQEMRSKVLNRLRSLPSLNSLVIQEDDVHVMPYKEVQLLFKPNPNGWHHHNDSIQLFNEPTPYNILRETLDFYLLCDSALTADMLAADLRHNPGSTLNGLQLVMECRGLVLDNCSNSAGLKKPIAKFNLSTNNSQKDDGVVTVAHLNEMTAVPVFWSFRMFSSTRHRRIVFI